MGNRMGKATQAQNVMRTSAYRRTADTTPFTRYRGTGIPLVPWGIGDVYQDDSGQLRIWTGNSWAVDMRQLTRDCVDHWFLTPAEEEALLRSLAMQKRQIDRLG
jgi:hypothetical protein